MPFYFPHDADARNDEKILRLRIRHKAAGYGVYFMIIEILRGKKDLRCPKDYNAIAFELREDAALVKSVIEDFGLFVFTEGGKYFHSESLDKRMSTVSRISRARSEAAKKRWNTKKQNNNGQQPGTQEGTDQRRRGVDKATAPAGSYTGGKF